MSVLYSLKLELACAILSMVLVDLAYDTRLTSPNQVMKMKMKMKRRKRRRKWRRTRKRTRKQKSHRCKMKNESL